MSLFLQLFVTDESKDLPETGKSVSGWYNLYIGMLWDLQKASLVSLKTLSSQ